MSHNITVEGGKSVRLPTKGKYCDRDIVVTAEGVELPQLESPGSAADLMEGKQLIDGEGNVVDGAFTITPELTEQGSLIDQIKAALQGKAAGGSGLPTQEKTVEITENGTVEVLPDEGYTLSKVTATVAVPVPEGYVKPTGTLEVTENGSYDVAGYASVEVNVEASGGDDDTDTNTTAMSQLLLGKITELYNDKAVGTLAAYMFYEQDALTRIELPNIQYLKERCFYGCSALETLLLPRLVGYTYQYMAAYCPKLVTVDIHNCNYISSYSFRGCTSLAKLDLHKATNIGTYAFYGCTKLDTLILRMDAVPTLGGTNAFTNTKIAGGTGYIYVPAALVDSYKAATNWSTYAAQFRAIEDYPDICGGSTV